MPAAQACILYTYDLGDSWQHSIQLESIHSAKPKVGYPRVLTGARSCPPEDCGGTGGYADLLEILLDPTHKEFEDMRDWAGEFNAEAFSVDAVNSRCAATDPWRLRNRFSLKKPGGSAEYLQTLYSARTSDE